MKLLHLGAKEIFIIVASSMEITTYGFTLYEKITPLI